MKTINLYNEFLNKWYWFVLENSSKNWVHEALNEDLMIDLEIVQENSNIHWNYDILADNATFIAKENYIRKRLQEWFKRSDLKAELMATVWHPRNFEKFKYWDPETFGEEL